MSLSADQVLRRLLVGRLSLTDAPLQVLDIVAKMRCSMTGLDRCAASLRPGRVLASRARPRRRQP